MDSHVCGCSEPMYAFGLCRSHYMRQRYSPSERRERERKSEALHPGRATEQVRRSRKRFERIETYVAYAGSRVIYVGRTMEWGRRIRTHQLDGSPWLNEATEIVHRYHASFADSLVDEALLIRTHQPQYNREGVTR